MLQQSLSTAGTCIRRELGWHWFLYIFAYLKHRYWRAVNCALKSKRKGILDKTKTGLLKQSILLNLRCVKIHLHSGSSFADNKNITIIVFLIECELW